MHIRLPYRSYRHAVLAIGLWIAVLQARPVHADSTLTVTLSGCDGTQCARPVLSGGGTAPETIVFQNISTGAGPMAVVDAVTNNAVFVTTVPAMGQVVWTPTAAHYVVLCPGVCFVNDVVIFIEEGSSCVAPARDLVHWWPLDGIHGSPSSPYYEDLAGSLSATPTGGVPVVAGEVCGGIGSAASSTLTTASEQFVAPDFTVLGWVKPHGGTDSSVNVASYTGDRINLHVSNAGAMVAVHCDNLLCFSWTSPVALPKGIWSLVAMTFSHTQKQEGLYADGNLVFSQQLPSVGQTVGGGAWTVGDHGGGADVTTGPDVDEVQVYSRVLSGAEISAIFAAGRHGVCKPYSCNSAVSVPAAPRSVLFFLATAMLLLFTYWLPRKHERSSNAAHYG